MKNKAISLEASASGEPTLLEMIRNVLVTYKGTVGTPLALSDVSKIARVEPITLISSDLASTKEMYNILHGVLNIYAAYYLQAVSILSAQLKDARILKILDKTNPDRDIKTLLSSGYTAFESRKNMVTLSLENCKYKLPMLVSDNKGSISKEGFFTDEDENTLNTSINQLKEFEKMPLAVGKVIDVKFSILGEDRNSKASEVSIPVVVKLDTMIIPNDVINSILVSNQDEITFSSRLKDAMSGRIRFIKDFIFAQDLIKNQKKILFKDPTNMYSQILKRINNSRLYSALSGNISVAGVSSVVIISEENENEIQKKIGGKLSNINTREIIFNNTSAMMIVVVDREWTRTSIYIRDIDGYSQNSFDDFKQASNKDNNDIVDLFKQFSMGNAPSF